MNNHFKNTFHLIIILLEIRFVLNIYKINYFNVVIQRRVREFLMGGDVITYKQDSEVIAP